MVLLSPGRATKSRNSADDVALVCSPGVEVDSGNPVLVPVAAHDELARWQRPELPRGVVGRRRNNRLLGMHPETAQKRKVR